MGIYSPQASAITGRKTSYSSDMLGVPSYIYDTKEETPERQYKYSDAHEGGVMGVPDLQRGYYGGMNKNDMLAAMEEGYYEGLTQEESLANYVESYKIPDDVLEELTSDYNATRPAGDLDISQGIPEGQSNLSGMPALDNINKGQIEFGQGNIGKGLVSTVKGASQIATLPAQIPIMMAKPIISKVNEEFISPLVSKVKGLFSDDTSNLGSSVASGSGMTGLSGPMGLAAVEADLGATSPSSALGVPESPIGIDLADLEIGGFGDDGDDGGLGGGPGGTPGGLSGGVGTW